MSPRPLPAPRPLTTRRTTLAALTGGTVLAAGLSACEDHDPARPGESPDPAADADPDVALLERARSEVDEVVALVAALASRHRRMAAPLQPLLALHTAHREVLAGDGTPAPTPTPPPLSGPPGELWTLLLARERTLQRRLAAAAVQADSGTLARLLASMSAGIAAHVAAAHAAVGTGVAW